MIIRKLMSGLLLIATLICLTGKVFALSCAGDSSFDPQTWQGSIFEAKTIVDSDQKTQIDIQECIQNPCKEGVAFVNKNYWDFGRPRTNTGDLRIWTVYGKEGSNEYEVIDCSVPIRDHWEVGDKGKQSNEIQKLECESKKGVWGREEGRGRVKGCNLPTSDVGKMCTDSTQCESACVVNKITGQNECYGYKIFKGCGKIESGKVICVD